MKKVKYLTFLLMLFTGCLFTACGGDDDDESSGTQGGSTSSKSELNISGQSSINGFDHAYWYYYDEKNTTSKNEVWCHLEFWTFDYLSYLKEETSAPSMFSFVSVVVFAGETVPSEIPTGDFFLEDMHCIVNAKTTDQTSSQYEDDQSYEGKVSIMKVGNSYSVSVTNVTLVPENKTEPTYKASFSFTGSIPHAQEMNPYQ